ncbi:MAG: hypothetical protein Q3985_04075, partial [Eubacteriales bacterium]|nr:hypothetical protein [Eubacteriales bacterium]
MNDEYNNENNLYHYNYRAEPQPQDDYRPSRPTDGTSFRAANEQQKRGVGRKKGIKIAALVIACALVAG